MEHFEVPLENVKSLRDVVLDSLRHAIIVGKIKPGEPLKERELAQMLGVSTTPIKEALRILNHEGLVETFPRRGTFVSEMVNCTIEELQMVRANLDSLAAKLAAKKMTDEEIDSLGKQVKVMESLVKVRSIERLRYENTKFHNMIRNGAQNSVIFQMLANVSGLELAFRERTLQNDREVENIFEEHFGIYEAIRDRDPVLAELRMKNHINRSTADVLKMN